MEENSSNPEQNLELLLLTRSFAELSDEEKGFVLSQMTSDEYETCREAVAGSRQVFANEFSSNRPDPLILDRLLKAFPPDQKSRSYLSVIIRSIFTFRIPLYQPALAVAALLTGLFFLPGRNYETVRYIARTDTVYLERSVTVPNAGSTKSYQDKTTRPVIALKVSNSGKGRKKNPGSMQATPSHDQYVRGSYEKIRLLALNKGGSSARDDSSLMRLLVAAN